MNNFLLLIFILIRIVSNPIASVFQKKLANDNSALVINLYSYLFLSIFCIFCLPSLNGFHFSTKFIVLTLSCGLLCTLGMLCTIKAVNIGELSVIGPINSYKSVIALIIAFILLKEIPSIQGIIGIILIAFGSKFIFRTAQKSSIISLIKRKDLQFRFLAMTLTAIEAVLLKKIILMSSSEVCFIFWCFTGLFWTFIISVVSKKEIKVRSSNVFLSVLVVAICLGFMQFSTNYVFSKMNVGFALSLFQLSSVVTVLFGYKFFHEENIISKLFGSLIMIIGSCLIISD